MSVVRKVSTGVAWNTASVVVGKAVMFLNVFIVLNFLSLYEYGFSELVMSAISMIGIVMLPGLTSTVTADLAVERGRGNFSHMKHVFNQFLYLNVATGFAAWALLFFGSHPVAQFFGNPYAAQFLQIASFTFLISPFRVVSQVLATVMLRFFDLSFYGVIEEIFKLIFLVLFVVYLQLGIHGLMYAFVFSQLCAVICYAHRSLSAYRVFSHAKEEGSIRFWNIMRNHRKWSVGASYAGTLATNSRIWLIKLLLGTEAVGLFAFAFGLFSHLASLMPLTAVITPIVPSYVDKKDQLIRIVRASLKLQVIVAVGFLIAAYAGAYLFVLILFPKYLAAVPLLYILLIALLSNSVASIFTPVFSALKEQRSLLLSNVLKLTLTVVILPPAVYLFGTLGIGVEMVLTTFFNTIERYMRLKRLLPGFSFRLQEIMHPDAYEREAMRTIVAGVRTRFAGILPAGRDR